MHTALDQPIGVAAQLGLVDFAARIERNDVRGEDAAKATDRRTWVRFLEGGGVACVQMRNWPPVPFARRRRASIGARTGGITPHASIAHGPGVERGPAGPGVFRGYRR